jgi:hypothetical protein
LAFLATLISRPYGDPLRIIAVALWKNPLRLQNQLRGKKAIKIFQTLNQSIVY